MIDRGPVYRRDRCEQRLVKAGGDGFLVGRGPLAVALRRRGGRVVPPIEEEASSQEGMSAPLQRIRAPAPSKSLTRFGPPIRSGKLSSRGRFKGSVHPVHDRLQLGDGVPVARGGSDAEGLLEHRVGDLRFADSRRRSGRRVRGRSAAAAPCRPSPQRCDPAAGLSGMPARNATRRWPESLFSSALNGLRFMASAISSAVRTMTAGRKPWLFSIPSASFFATALSEPLRGEHNVAALKQRRHFAEARSSQSALRSAIRMRSLPATLMARSSATNAVTGATPKPPAARCPRAPDRRRERNKGA